MDEPRSDDIFYRNDVPHYPYLVLRFPNLDFVSSDTYTIMFSFFYGLTKHSNIEVKTVSVIERSTTIKPLTYPQIQELGEDYKRSIRNYKLEQIRLNLLTKLYKDPNE